MNFQSMEYFAAVARERSFTKAAQVLHLSQQTLSAHIAGLEQELGCPLFVRHIPLELTYAGEVFLRYALSFRSQYRELQHVFYDIQQQQRGELRIGIAHTRGRVVLPGLITAFRQRYPGVALHMLEDTNDQLAEHLLSGRVDLAIADFPQKLPGVCLTDFYRESVLLFLPRELLARVYGSQREQLLAGVRRTGSIAPLAEFPFLMNHQADIAGQFARKLFREAGFTPRISAQSENVELLLELCARQLGACFSPQNLAQATLSPAQQESLEVVRFPNSLDYTIRIGYLEQKQTWSVLTAFLQMARACGTQQNGPLSGGGAAQEAGKGPFWDPI